jgi:hypothetical protein
MEGWHYVPVGFEPLMGPFSTLRQMNKCVACGGMISNRGKIVFGEEPDPQPICPPHELPYEEKRISLEKPGNSTPDLWHGKFIGQRMCCSTLQLTFQSFINAL